MTHIASTDMSTLQPSEIAISGQAQVTSQPDCINFTLKLAATDLVYDAMLKTMEVKMQQLKVLLTDVPLLKPMVTKSFEIEEKWRNRYDDDKRRFEGYSASHTVKVLLPLDTALLGRLLALIGQGDLKPEIRFGFEVMDMTVLHEAARLRALEAAKQSAQHVARQMDLKLIGIRRIEYITPTPSSPSSLELNMSDLGPSTSYSMDLVLIPDDVSVRDKVSVVWLAVPA